MTQRAAVGESAAVESCIRHQQALVEALRSRGAWTLEGSSPATDEQLLLAHTSGWLRRLKANDLSADEELLWSLPSSKDILPYAWQIAGRTLAACRRALADGAGVCLGGGLHHAYPSHGEGFCPVNDLAVAVKALLREGLIRRPMIVDLDAHQGNGTAFIFQGAPQVFTFSMHNAAAYPTRLEPGSLDVDLEPGTSDDDYLRSLRRHLPAAWDRHRPDLVVYLAGADPYRRDPIGGLGLTEAGLRARDAYVLGRAARRGAPVAVTMGGGYGPVDDLVRIRLATLDCVVRAFPRARRTVFV